MINYIQRAVAGSAHILFKLEPKLKAITLRAPGGLDRIARVELPDPGAPGPGAIRVRLHASSLNFHDYGVVSTPNRVSDGRIPMSDGAGIVEAVGDGVSEFKVGDHVVPCFFPNWLEGPPPIADFSTVPGDGVDGYAREIVVAPATAFTNMPKQYSFAEGATLTTAGVTAWRALVVNGALKAGEKVLVLGTGGVSIFALQIAKAMGALVAATSSSDEKLERVRALGAGHTINYRHHPNWGCSHSGMDEWLWRGPRCRSGRARHSCPIHNRCRDWRTHRPYRSTNRPSRRDSNGRFGDQTNPAPRCSSWQPQASERLHSSN